MARRSPTPIITHTEIICYAICHLGNEMEDMRKRCEGRPEVKDVLEEYLAQREPKLEALKQLYHIETGSEFC